MRAGDRRITVASPMQLGGVQFNYLRGVAIGFDECDDLVEAVDFRELSDDQRSQLEQHLETALGRLRRRGAERLH